MEFLKEAVVWLGRFLPIAAGMLISSAAWSETKAIEMIVSLKSAKTVVVRAMPDQESAAIAFVENGKPILRAGSEETNGFVMVRLADGRAGWTKANFLAPAAANVVPRSEEPKVVMATAIATPATASNGAVPIAAALPVNDLSLALEKKPLIMPMPAATGIRAERPGVGLSAVHLFVAGLVGLLIGLLVGWKSGMVYTAKAIHERYEVIS